MTSLTNSSDRELLIDSVLDQLCNGTTTFADAATIIGIPKNEVESMLDGYLWMPSPEQMRVICDAERETLAAIRAMFGNVIQNV